MIGIIFLLSVIEATEFCKPHCDEKYAQCIVTCNDDPACQSECARSGLSVNMTQIFSNEVIITTFENRLADP